MQHPTLFKDVICHIPVQLTAKEIIATFVPQHSRKGTAKRRLEGMLMSFWRDFVQDAEGTCSSRNTVYISFNFMLSCSLNMINCSFQKKT